MPPSNFEILKGILDGSTPGGVQEPVLFPPPIGKTLGFRLTDVSADGPSATIELETDPAVHGNPMGTVHGGVLCDIADAAIGSAHWSSLKEGESFVSVDFRINFFRPVRKNKLKATARAVHIGASISYYVCDIVRQDDGKFVATATSTVMKIRPRSPQAPEGMGIPHNID